MDQDRVPVLNIQPVRRRRFASAHKCVSAEEGADAIEPAQPDPSGSSSLQVRRKIRQLGAASAPPALPLFSSLQVRRKIRQLPPDAIASAASGNSLRPEPLSTVQDLPTGPCPAAGLPAHGQICGEQIVLYRQPNFTVSAFCRPGQSAPLLRKPEGQAGTPRQRERVAASETRRMPQVELPEVRRTRTLPVPPWLEVLVVLLLLAGSVAVHAYHLFVYPAYTADEGTYMQNAWAVTQGRLSLYPYGYGHPPAGWIQLALWLRLSGPFTFGEAQNGGRLLMLVYAAACVPLVYLIARRLGGSQSAALLGMAVFAFSPLSVSLQREVLLDNIATFWLLVALALIVSSRSRLLFLSGAALALGLAILSKEVIAVCLPALVYAVWLHTTPFQRKFALVTFLYGTLALVSTFALLALLKGEFFPFSWNLPWDRQPHLSLLDTYIGQVQRGQSQGSLLESWHEWWQTDALLLLAGVAATALNLLSGWRRREHLLAGLLAVSYWALLARGGVVYPFYLLPLIPLLALNIALALHALLGWLSRLIQLKPARAVLLLLLLSLLLPYDAIGALRQASASPALVQQQALTWIGSHLPRTAYIVISPDLYLDLRLPGGTGVGSGQPFLRAEVYWEVASDPAVRDQVLHDDWNSIDYLVVNDQMRSDLASNAGQFALLQQALAHATLLVSFHARDTLHTTTLWIYQVQHDDMPLLQRAPQRLAQG
jgi:4-amino-4-deoxy-L-arabinose transferase-like glycosyltransferase